MLNFREILARLAFPIVMGVGLFATFYFIHIKEVAINKVTFPVVFIALIIIALLERLIPFRSSWNKNDGDVGNDAINLVITQTLIPRLFTPFGYIILEVSTIGLYNPAYPKDYIGQLKAPFQGEVDKPVDFYEREDYYHNLVKNE